MLRITTLGHEDYQVPSFLDLLREAAGQEDEELRRILADVFPSMRVIGSLQDGSPVAFAAFQVHVDSISLEYIAVHETLRGQGFGSALINHIRKVAANVPLTAETDDDAVDFYRRLSFTVTAAPTDSRWPNRRRYRCSLPPLSAV